MQRDRFIARTLNALYIANSCRDTRIGTTFKQENNDDLMY